MGWGVKVPLCSQTFRNIGIIRFTSETVTDTEIQTTVITEPVETETITASQIVTITDTQVETETTTNQVTVTSTNNESVGDNNLGVFALVSIFAFAIHRKRLRRNYF